LRRRSVAERNGLTVVAVAKSSQDPVLHTLAPTIQTSTGVPQPTLLVLPAAVGIDTKALDFGTGVSTNVSDGSVDELIEQLPSADSVVLATRAGKSDLRDVYELARTVSSMGGKNVCVVLLARGSAYREALD
ncbi:MAG: hypothetical protein ACR2OH_14280, partial [Microthrixaceae bacterium]